MKIKDILHETYASLSSNKTRSGLTALGIIIGIGSVVSMISIGQGASGSIQASIQAIGSNLVLVMPGFQRGAGTSNVSAGRGSAMTLKQEDADAIQKEITIAKAVAPEISRRHQITAKGKNTNTQVIGTVSSYPQVRNVQIEMGAFISDQNVRSLSRVAVLGPTTALDLFGEGSSPIGQSIRINRVDFKIVGVTKIKGGTGFANQDDIIFVPISTAQRFLAGDDYVTTISVQAENPDMMAVIKQQITDLLMQRHNISNPQLADFQILNQQDIVQTASAVTNTMTILLASIAGISLVVGGIGIMNMMLTTVMERTREIGLRKAIGAKRRDINLQFLSEAVMLTFVGGILGIILGWIVSLAVAKFAGIPTQISFFSILLAFGVSAGIGIVFGYYPARRASSLNPIEALRYE
ncbi:MAG: ABC transporter, permease protein [Candidatus Magasanikbacteria bacterium GW2011_GWA2_40_10]|uniref:ABC transporter, permease protein n=1 Tax=Candidatus Magasanikbacteria bacterium GW2011_GWA2_40_10 TaxID=1619037 RepID=A0A0G0SIM7_9BACT|nr:MAG: ABC transporter, permease protein [Candidatus Magasanikbacteria bacterium GW2011_GWA2_40_10]